MPKRILVVGEEASPVRALVARLLGLQGRYQVRIGAWNEDPLASVREFLPDLILLDETTSCAESGLPAVDFAKNLQTRDVPIMLLSRRITTPESDATVIDDRRRTRRTTIPMPIDPTYLLEKVRELLAPPEPIGDE